MKTKLVLLIVVVFVGNDLFAQDSIQPLLIRPPMFNELDSTRRQVAVAAFVLPLQRRQLYYANLEVNFPAQKYGWYNSFSVHYRYYYSSTWNHPDQNLKRTTWEIGAGKKYEWIHARTYFSLGLSLGGFWSLSRNSTDYKEPSYGIFTAPHIEAGMNFKRIIVAVGARFPVKIGYYQLIYLGNPPEVFKLDKFGIRAYPEVSPYLKIILK